MVLSGHSMWNMVDLHSIPRDLHILGTGAVVGQRALTSAELDDHLGLQPGTVERTTGVTVRGVHDGTAAQLGATAARQALDAAGLQIDDIDLILAASATPDQLLPCNAALVHAELQPPRDIPAWDVNASCLSFLVAVDVAASLLQTGRHQRILIVSSDIASGGLDWTDLGSSGIFGDGAAAVVVSADPGPDTIGDSGRLLAMAFSTHSDLAHACELPGGGSRIRPDSFDGDFVAASKFRMQGGPLLRLAARELPPLIDRVLDSAGLTMDDIDLVIAHQASHVALDWLRGALKVPDERFFNHYSSRGNMVAASLPSALHDAIATGRLRPGHRVLLVGTGAGMSMSGAVLCL